jgi:hypothetical protein
MAERKPFRGVTFNRPAFMGVLAADPQIAGDNAAAYITLETVVPIKTADSWEDRIINVPLVVTDPTKVARAAKYLHAGDELYAEGYYDSWENNGVPAHGFIVTMMKFGHKAYKDKGGGMGLPPGQQQ